MTKAQVGREEARGRAGRWIIANYHRLPKRAQGAVSEWLDGQRAGRKPNQIPIAPTVVAWRDPKTKVVRFRGLNGRYVGVEGANRRIRASNLESWFAPRKAA